MNKYIVFSLSDIFLKEIKRRPVAVNHIIHFLKAHYDFDELIKLLRYAKTKSYCG